MGGGVVSVLIRALLQRYTFKDTGTLWILTSFIITMLEIPWALPIPSSSLSSYLESFMGDVEGVVVGSFFGTYTSLWGVGGERG